MNGNYYDDKQTPAQVARRIVSNAAPLVEYRLGVELEHEIEIAIEVERDRWKYAPPNTGCATCCSPATRIGEIRFTCDECIPRL